MGTIIIKPEADQDFYVGWSTVVEALAWFGNRQQAIRYAGDDALRRPGDHPEVRLARADQHGSSSLDGFGRWDAAPGRRMMTRTDTCAGQDGVIEWRQTGVWDSGAWVHADDGTRFRDNHVAQPMPQCPKCGSPKYVTETIDPWTVRCMECGHEEEAMNVDHHRWCSDQPDASTTDDLDFAERTLTERVTQLNQDGRTEAADDMPLIEVVVANSALSDPDILRTAEWVARMGRKAAIHLTITGGTGPRPTGAFPSLEWFGGSTLLREHAYRGASVHAEASR